MKHHQKGIFFKNRHTDRHRLHGGEKIPLLMENTNWEDEMRRYKGNKKEDLNR